MHQPLLLDQEHFNPSRICNCCFWLQLHLRPQLPHIHIQSRRFHLPIMSCWLHSLQRQRLLCLQTRFLPLQNILCFALPDGLRLKLIDSQLPTVPLPLQKLTRALLNVHNPVPALQRTMRDWLRTSNVPIRQLLYGLWPEGKPLF